VNIGDISLDSELPSVSDLLAGKSDGMETDSISDSLFLHYLLDYQGLSCCFQKNLPPKITNKDGKNCNELYSITSLKFSCLTQNSLNRNYLDQLGASTYRPWTNNSGRLT